MDPERQTEHSLLAEIGAALLLWIAWVVGALALLVLVPEFSQRDYSDIDKHLAGVRISGQVVPLFQDRTSSGSTAEEQDEAALAAREQYPNESNPASQADGATMVWLGTLTSGTPVFSSDGVRLGVIRKVGVDIDGTVQRVKVALEADPTIGEQELILPAGQVDTGEGRATLHLTAVHARAAAILQEGVEGGLSCRPHER
jgi:hypothetical protein